MFVLFFKLSFSTGPGATSTHWKQTIFLLKQPVCVKRGNCVVCSALIGLVSEWKFSGDVLSGTICCTKDEKDCRSLKVYLNVDTPAGQQSKAYCLN